ncbi:MAG: GNAT family N-acetyltransferase, partial [Gammaproteobacteria bacterium]|nr:GNAT family N-acetyltransferase [Gammaproteobacteria bacterium]
IGHVRNGKNGVVFSLAVYPDHRNKGIASLLIKEIVRVSKSKQKKNILLLCKDNLVDFYRDLGFGYGGLSSSKYGGSTWHEMRYPLSLQA